MFEANQRWVVGRLPLVLACLGLLFLVLPAYGDSDSGTDTSSELAAEFEANMNANADAQASGGGSGSQLSKLQIHGFLTQAYAEGKFVNVPPGIASPTLNELSLGIPEDGTTDYRQMALQFRYDMSAKDIFIVQLSNRAVGFSPIESLEDEIDLDWAFYERRLGDQTSIKVGRVQIPFGIYNEIRDVGTVLPFYRPPFGIYRNGAFVSETVDGLFLGHTFFSQSNWSLDGSIYLGEFDDFEVASPGSLPPGVPTENISRNKDVVGMQLWLNTPLPDLRLGFSAYTRTLTNSIFLLPGDEADFDNYLFSFDGIFGRATVRAEFLFIDSAANFPPFNFDFDFFFYHAQLGIRLADNFKIWFQADIMEQEQNDPVLLVEPGELDFRTDLGITLNYWFSSNIVLKAEYHEVDEEASIFNPVFGPDPTLPPLFEILPVALNGGNYTIISLSVSF